MPIIRKFSIVTNLATLMAMGDSMGAHVAAKLDSFGSDERTLTEELCDMLCIWAQVGSSLPVTSGPATPFLLTLVKVSPREEAKLGADLELIIATPEGVKRCLIQAKVLDQSKHLLRLYSREDWKKLRVQLKSIRASAGSLGFLMIYVPGSQLDGGSHGFPTWEQGFLASRTAGRSSSFGATLIAIDDLLTPKGLWKRRPGIKYLSGGKFAPEGISFTRLLLEILCCERGTWDQIPPDLDADRAKSTLMAAVSQIALDDWLELTRFIRRTLEARTTDMG